jgi:hypothetical protein
MRFSIYTYLVVKNVEFAAPTPINATILIMRIILRGKEEVKTESGP